MERVVGATLVLLGVYVVVGLLHHGRDFRMRSRWMLVIGGLRRLRANRRQPLVIEHDHEHAEDEAHGHTHVDVHVPAGHRAAAPHRHLHRHVAPMPDDPFMTYGRPAAFFIGMLHGVGAETPTQLLIFVTVAGAGGRGAGVGLLVAFVVGLLTSNTVVALAGTFGFLGATRNWTLYVTISVITAVASLVIGSLFLVGDASLFPSILGG
jgi:high-affinity nickel-transport protein